MMSIIWLALLLGLFWGGQALAWTGACKATINVPSMEVESGLSYSAGHPLTGWFSGAKCEIGKAGLWSTMGIRFSELRYDAALPMFKDSDGASYTIFNTGSAGIGFIVKVRMESDRSDVARAITMSNWDGQMGDAWSWANIFLSMRLVAIGGPITSQQVSWDLPLGSHWLKQGWPTYNEDWMSTGIYVPSFRISHKTPGCVTSSGSYSINMGIIPSRRLQNIQSTVTGSPLDIDLNCMGAVNGSASIQFTDMANQPNTGDLLSLTADSTAKGVQVKLDAEVMGLFGGSYNSSGGLLFRVKYAPPSSLFGGNNSTELPLSPINNGHLVRIRLIPAYVRIGDLVAGSANAMVMMTIVYK
ncbi:fimbrial protein [Aeromonas bivalvium]|uniref:fimbrial protein n=1 Tax=Aeromonas bivalvium TaxID=440079 RepID=UPI000DCFCD51|nr:fimbrial protein [Aeromonas bivalvium]